MICARIPACRPEQLLAGVPGCPRLFCAAVPGTNMAENNNRPTMAATVRRTINHDDTPMIVAISDCTQNPSLPNEQEPFSYLTLEVGKFAWNARKHNARPVANDFFQGSEQFHVLAVALATNDMARFGRAHRSQNVCDLWRVRVSRFNRTDTSRNYVIATMMGKLAGEFVSVLETGKKFQCSFSMWLDDESLDERRFVGVHSCTVYRIRTCHRHVANCC
jgi:hypothetical protein